MSNVTILKSRVVILGNRVIRYVKKYKREISSQPLPASVVVFQLDKRQFPRFQGQIILHTALSWIKGPKLCGILPESSAVVMVTTKKERPALWTSGSGIPALP